MTSIFKFFVMGAEWFKKIFLYLQIKIVQNPPTFKVLYSYETFIILTFSTLNVYEVFVFTN